tara:strand:- start:7 stop:147 length:141 start_codon:yes stop_codon:yes gene_type:complete
MRKLSLLMLFLFTFGVPALSHGSKSDCSEECDGYYCPTEKNKNSDS